VKYGFLTWAGNTTDFYVIQSLQSSSGDDPAFFSIGTGFFRVKYCWSVKLITHLYLATILRVNGSINPLPTNTSMA
jgi:hypothetical protein